MTRTPLRPAKRLALGASRRMVDKHVPWLGLAPNGRNSRYWWNASEEDPCVFDITAGTVLRVAGELSIWRVIRWLWKPCCTPPKRRSWFTPSTAAKSTSFWSTAWRFD